jgi:CxC5 like cysteine cluster associated with KDZ transposases
MSGWIKHLARALQERLGTQMDQLFQTHDIGKNMSNDQVLQVTSAKLVNLAQILKFYPLDQHGKFLRKLKPVSQKMIQPIHIICPGSVECETITCNPRSLLQASKPRDIPRVTLIQDFTIYNDVPVLTGKCPACQTLYYADHE